jgi:hypothetical protein
MVDKEKLNEMIDYFKTKKENEKHFFFILRDKDKTNFDNSIKLVTIFIAVSVGLITVGLIFFGGIIVEFTLIIIYFIYRNYANIRDKNALEYINKKVGFESVIEYLQIIKINDYKVSLDPLIEKINHYTNDFLNWKSNFKSSEEFENNWLEQFINEIDKIEKAAK